MKNSETKKEKLIVIISTIVLLLLVVGSTFAYYYANFIGNKENHIISGRLEIKFDNESAMNLTDQKPVSDEVGSAIPDDQSYTFDVNSIINGNAQINYDLAFELISNEGITNDDVKINLLKKYVLDGVAKELEENGFPKESIEKYLGLFKEITNDIEKVVAERIRRYNSGQINMR